MTPGSQRGMRPHVVVSLSKRTREVLARRLQQQKNRFPSLGATKSDCEDDD